MKRILSLALMLFCALALLPSCEKAPFITMTGPRSITFTQDGGIQSFAFSCNRDWNASSSESWISVSPASSSKSDNEVTVTISCSPNTTYDPRNATITVRVDELKETISVTQDAGLGLLVSPNTFDLSNAAQDIEIEVQKNVRYAVTIDESCMDWISQKGTKALSSETIVFSIAANEGYDNREGKVTFKQTDGSLSSTVTIKQHQTDRLAIEKEIYAVSKDEQQVEVMVNSNVLFDVEPHVDWIKHAQTKALDNTAVVLKIEQNTATGSREGIVDFKQKDGSLNVSVIVNQAGPVPEGAIDLGVIVTREDGSRYRLFWADRNLGAYNPEDPGDYYAWGETETKTDYGWGTYKWGVGNNASVSKYCPADKPENWAGEGAPDNKMVLDFEDDAARVRLGGKWRMPTRAEQRALLNQCVWTSSELNGKKGYEVRSKSNSSFIFLPTAGSYSNTWLNGPDLGGYYWSSSVSSNLAGDAICIFFHAENPGQLGLYGYLRSVGCSIRPVTE